MGAGNKPRALLQTRFAEGDCRVSPDGRWIMYRSDESGKMELYVRSFPSMGEKHVISNAREGVFLGTQFFPAFWFNNEIIFLARDGFTMLSVPVRTGASFSSEPPRRLMRLPRDAADFAVFPDGQRLLVVTRDTGGIPDATQVTLNWTALIARK